MKSTRVPIYMLYGEQDVWPMPDMMHCESIEARSRLHDWHIKPHQHAGLLQVLYLQRGIAQLHLDGEESDMESGRMLLVPQNFVHGFKFSPDALGYVVTVAYPFVVRLAQTMEGGPGWFSHPVLHTVGSDEDSTCLISAFSAFVREYRGSAPHRHLLVESLLSTVIVMLARKIQQCRPQGARGVKDNPLYLRFTDLLDQWWDKHCSLDNYAKELGITTAHLNLLCRRIAQKSALDLVHERLLLEAKRSLAYTSMSISELSYAIGFSDPAYFTRFFKREAGESPRDFRRRIEQLSGEE
ncbi:helix-turn-helix domain-containing protein [Cupriavidus sp. amp6]|uniref:helix-turn-helix domain-containing protein n=1 Tax=Cupriavidus sp. amp6 TaxID=388051 RepID=UPI00041CF21B|nr:helix-turn-helix domain-containing protein [Cupriavidus sp. amp6]